MTRTYRYCGLCAFFQPDARDRPDPGREQSGSCRRYCPQTAAGWPSVSEADWCGEFEPAGNVDVPFDADDGGEATVTHLRRRW